MLRFHFHRFNLNSNDNSQFDDRKALRVRSVFGCFFPFGGRCIFVVTSLGIELGTLGLRYCMSP